MVLFLDSMVMFKTRYVSRYTMLGHNMYH